MTWLLCDYGEVLCLAPPAADRTALEQAARWSWPGFWETYWEHRPDYDRGDVSSADYWARVLGWRPDRATLERLIEHDTAGWLHPNHDSLAGAARAAGRGLRLALFSNAPVEVAAAIDTREWLADYSPRLFSCRLRAVKPEPAAFRAALDALEAEPGDVVFVDDRAVNVEAAQAAGIRATLFVDPAQFDQLDP